MGLLLWGEGEGEEREKSLGLNWEKNGLESGRKTSARLRGGCA